MSEVFFFLHFIFITGMIVFNLTHYIENYVFSTPCSIQGTLCKPKTKSIHPEGFSSVLLTKSKVNYVQKVFLTCLVQYREGLNVKFPHRLSCVNILSQLVALFRKVLEPLGLCPSRSRSLGVEVDGSDLPLSPLIYPNVNTPHAGCQCHRSTSSASMLSLTRWPVPSDSVPQNKPLFLYTNCVRNSDPWT